MGGGGRIDARKNIHVGDKKEGKKVFCKGRRRGRRNKDCKNDSVYLTIFNKIGKHEKNNLIICNVTRRKVKQSEV